MNKREEKKVRGLLLKHVGKVKEIWFESYNGWWASHCDGWQSNQANCEHCTHTDSLEELAASLEGCRPCDCPECRQVLRVVDEVSGALSTYLARIGAKGGKATSPAKVKASRANGRKGGRPRIE